MRREVGTTAVSLVVGMCDLEVKIGFREGNAGQHPSVLNLLMMGTESESNLVRFVVGNVSQRAVPNAAVPVMTARTIESGSAERPRVRNSIQ
ncbi:hypothetical protein [Halostagnicola bangensis]